MGKLEKTLWQTLSGNSDQNVAFADLIHVLESLGFQKRIKGSHHLFSKDGVEEIINIQTAGGKAKPYQVKQVSSAPGSTLRNEPPPEGAKSFLGRPSERLERAVIVKYQLAGE